MHWLLKLAYVRQKAPQDRLVLHFFFFYELQVLCQVRVEAGQHTLQVALLLDEVDD